MSKKSKAASKLKRLSKKRALKTANRAKYQELARIGQNSKSRRFMRNAKKAKKKIKSHPNGMCGNIGCKRCNPGFAKNRPVVVDKTLVLTPKEKYLLRVGYVDLYNFVPKEMRKFSHHHWTRDENWVKIANG